MPYMHITRMITCDLQNVLPIVLKQ